MSVLLWSVLVCYLAFGALLATALQVLDSGTSGRALDGRGLVRWPLTTLLWLPWILWQLTKFLAIFVLPSRWWPR